ncbi:MAG: DNA-processing protein DprA [Candidatus Fimousia sp.]
MRYTFPRRNRLIGAWAKRIIVIAPGKGSGALITAEYGRKYGRQVEIIHI